MTDGQLLLLLFALIYLSDTMVWVSLSGYAVSSRWRSDWRLRSPSPRFEGLGGGLVTLQPFPPLGTVFVTEGWPFSVTQEGISPVSPEGPIPGIPPAPPKGSQCWKWEEIERISVDRKRLLINGGSFARTSGETRARHLAALLRRLRSAVPTGREEAIHREVSRAFRSRDATRRVAALLKALRPLRINCCLLFVVSFLVLPPVYWWFGEGRPTWIALAMMWLLMVLCSVEYLLIHRRLYPGQVGERWQHFFLGLLLPHHGMRTLDALTRNFLVGYHPLAVAAALTFGIAASAMRVAAGAHYLSDVAFSALTTLLIVLVGRRVFASRSPDALCERRRPPRNGRADPAVRRVESRAVEPRE